VLGRDSQLPFEKMKPARGVAGINHQRLLPPGRYWINVRAVELRCDSTWRCLFGQCLIWQNLIVNGSHSSALPRAYSSIGQSPRLITGLFLVRTQVGPLFSHESLSHKTFPEKALSEKTQSSSDRVSWDRVSSRRSPWRRASAPRNAWAGWGAAGGAVSFGSQSQWRSRARELAVLGGAPGAQAANPGTGSDPGTWYSKSSEEPSSCGRRDSERRRFRVRISRARRSRQCSRQWLERSRSGAAAKQHGNEEPTYL
jgi:hypothetical protein